MTTPLKPGDVFHVLVPISLLRGTSLAATMDPLSLRRGDVLQVTEEMLLANQNLSGFSIFSIASDPDAQIKKYGRQLIGVGTWPAGIETWTVGTVEERQAHERALRQAAEIEDPHARKTEMDRIRRVFGGELKTSHSIGQYRGDAPSEKIHSTFGLVP
jgi:hypothetical protein